MMGKVLIKITLGLFIFTVVIGCVGRTPVGTPVKYKSTPVIFNAEFEDVWNAALIAAEELDWNIKSFDESKGEIKFQVSYVYDPHFADFVRIYKEPINKEIRNSDVEPYLREISYFEKITPPPAPPHPQYVREDLKLIVESLGSASTQVTAKYKIEPYNDYKIGYIGTVQSKGKLENTLMERINQILIYKPIGAPPLPPPPLQIEYGLTDVFFDFDKSYIRPDAIPVLRENADILRQNPRLKVIIQSYADVRGTNEYNMKLAQKRANATRQFLIKLGISPNRLIAVSKGETDMFGPGTSEEAYQLNRRSHFIPMQ